MENLNKRKLIPSLAAIAFCFCVSTSANATIALFEYAINIDGTVVSSGVPGDPFSGDSIPAGLDSEGLGAMTFNITGVGAHHFDAYFDHEIDESTNTNHNETGSVHGTAYNSGGVVQSWEIDEPGFAGDTCLDDPNDCVRGSNGGPYYGDIYNNTLDSALDNQIFYDAVDGQTLTPPDDVSMALGWDFSLVAGETATIMLMLGVADPGGFRLMHTDPDSNESFYFSSSLRIAPSVIPVPAAVWLFGSALAGLIGFSRRKVKV